MSGGVDSAVAAALLLKEGHQVSGVTMDTGNGKAAHEASLIAEELGIEHYIIDLKEKFKTAVIDSFIASYLNGETPNPCVVCNKELKFSAFFPLLEELQADYLATGHYVRLGDEDGRYLLYKAKYLPKDQSYFLYTLNQDVLSKTAFPLGGYNKDEIREMARQFDLRVAKKQESQDICFIPDCDYKAYIAQHAPTGHLPGNMIDKEGSLLGNHRGMAYYTVGQRKGLGLALGYPAYVIGLDKENNLVVIGKEEDLYRTETLTRDNNFLPFDQLNGDLPVTVKIRYKSPAVPAVITPEKELVRIKFKEPVRAVTPGQSAVFYQDDLLIGGGVIINRQ